MRRPAALLTLAGAVACSRGTPPPAPAAVTGPRSVLLVTIDTLRADRLGCYGDGQARTPVIDGLARASVVFERAYTPVPITLPAHASILTGTLPPVHGVRGNGAFALGPTLPTLAGALRAGGLRTAAFVGAFPLARRFGLDRGFDHYDDEMGKAPGVRYEFAERPAPAVVGAAVGWLAANRGPVFVWVHLFDPHAPYTPPPQYAGADPYRGEIAAADAALAPLMVAWEARGGGVVALLSDHGEAFGEHGEESHSLFVYDTTLHVPLMVRVPGLAARRVAEPVGITRVSATLIDAAGVAASVPGRSLLPLARGMAEPAEPLYAETLAPRLDFGWSELRSWREGRYKYVRAPRPELYDLQADPGETRDLARSQPQQAAALEAALARAAGGPGAMARARPDAEGAERLRALGYVQGAETARASGIDPKDRVQAARAIARAGGPFRDYAEAAAVYAALARQAPEVPVVNLRLADALLRSGRPAAALPYFERVIASGPRAADAYVGLATALAQLDRLDAAARVLQRGLRLDPGNGQLNYNLGEIARVRGRSQEARARYEAARLDPATRERAEQRLRGLQ